MQMCTKRLRTFCQRYSPVYEKRPRADEFKPCRRFALPLTRSSVGWAPPKVPAVVINDAKCNRRTPGGSIFRAHSLDDNPRYTVHVRVRGMSRINS